MDPHHNRDNAELTEAGDVHLLGVGYPPLGVTARAVVNRVIDGDTLVVDVRWPITIRLKDCWAPEITGEQKQFGLSAKQHLQRIAPVGSTVVINIDSRDANGLGDVMSFGRVVANAWRMGDQDSLSELMIDSGHAAREKKFQQHTGATP